MAGDGTALVGDSSVTVANGYGATISSTSGFSAATVANDRGTIPLNRSDYWVAGAENVVVYMLYHEETQQGN